MTKRATAQATEPTSSAPSLRAWAADKIERWSIDRIKPYERNARLHSEAQIALIAASMDRFGVTAPVLVDEEGVLIYGHGRLEAAKLLGYKELPVAVARGWSENEKRAYRISDNQLTLAGDWDLPVLNSELRAIDAEDFALPDLGFSVPQLDALLAVNEPVLQNSSPQLAGLKFAVIVECSDETDQATRLQQLSDLGLKCRALIS